VGIYGDGEIFHCANVEDASIAKDCCEKFNGQLPPKELIDVIVSV
jgi:hypothetical protein